MIHCSYVNEYNEKIGKWKSPVISVRLDACRHLYVYIMHFPTKMDHQNQLKHWFNHLFFCSENIHGLPALHISELKFPPGIQGISQPLSTLTIQTCILPAKTCLVYPPLVLTETADRSALSSRPASNPPLSRLLPSSSLALRVLVLRLALSVKCCVCSACFSSSVVEDRCGNHSGGSGGSPQQPAQLS